MKFVIGIDEANARADIAFQTNEGLEVAWSDLNMQDQTLIINTLAGFAELFHKDYVDRWDLDKLPVENEEEEIPLDLEQHD